MTWVRYFSKKIFGPYLPHMSPEKAQKYMNVMRMLYFFSASSMAIFIWKTHGNRDQELLEKGIPIIRDHSNAHKTFRTSDSNEAVLYGYVWGEGMKKEQWTKEEYYEVLEKEALERAKEAQRKALAEGRELPKDAIRLV